MCIRDRHRTVGKQLAHGAMPLRQDALGRFHVWIRLPGDGLAAGASPARVATGCSILTKSLNRCHSNHWPGQLCHRPGEREVTAIAGNPLDRHDVHERVRKALSTFLSAQLPRLDAVSDELGPVHDALAEFLLDGGKRLRPAFCFWGWRAAGGEDSDEIVTAAAGLELLHACALSHDDVMDGSDTRRGDDLVG